MFFEMEEYRADKSWAHFYKIKGSNIEVIKNVKVILLVQYSFREKSTQFLTQENLNLGIFVISTILHVKKYFLKIL